MLFRSQPGSSVPSSVPAAPIADAGGTDGVSDDSEPTLDDLAIAPSSDVSERGQVSDDFDDRRLANFICREVTRNFVRCDPEDEIADGGNTGGDGENNGGNNVGDRKSVVQGKSVDLGGRRIIKKKKR